MSTAPAGDSPGPLCFSGLDPFRRIDGGRKFRAKLKAQKKPKRKKFGGLARWKEATCSAIEKRYDNTEVTADVPRRKYAWEATRAIDVAIRRLEQTNRDSERRIRAMQGPVVVYRP
jgi:hypothetical protein